MVELDISNNIDMLSKKTQGLHDTLKVPLSQKCNAQLIYIPKICNIQWENVRSASALAAKLQRSGIFVRNLSAFSTCGLSPIGPIAVMIASVLIFQHNPCTGISRSVDDMDQILSSQSSQSSWNLLRTPQKNTWSGMKIDNAPRES